MPAPTHAWARAGEHAPDHGTDAGTPLVIDLDATLVTAHSEKENAAPNYKRGYGFHPLCAFVDHGDGGSGEPVAMLLRPGNSGSNMVFQLISRRYERGSLIITSNKSFSEWGAVLGDDVLATAILDRLLHDCDVITAPATDSKTEPPSGRFTSGFCVGEGWCLMTAAETMP